jgi:hypothetical protein
MFMTVNKVGEFELHLLIYRKQALKRIKLLPEVFSSLERLKKDVETAKALASKLDKDVGIGEDGRNGVNMLEERLKSVLANIPKKPNEGYHHFLHLQNTTLPPYVI